MSLKFNAVAPLVRTVVLAFCAPVLAQSPTSPQSLDPVQVTATRSPQRVSQALGDLTVLMRADIEAAGGRTLAELLSREAGVQMWSNGGLGQSSTVSLRGMESRHTLLLVDGVPVGSATLGTPAWDNLPLEAIERIEIVRGPMSGLYGSAAVGGVVQVFTRGGAEGLKLSGSAMVGSYTDRELTAGVRGGNDLIEGSLNVQRRNQAGFSASAVRQLQRRPRRLQAAFAQRPRGVEARPLAGRGLAAAKRRDHPLRRRPGCRRARGAGQPSGRLPVRRRGDGQLAHFAEGLARAG